MVQEKTRWSRLDRNEMIRWSLGGASTQGLPTRPDSRPFGWRKETIVLHPFVARTSPYYTGKLCMCHSKRLLYFFSPLDAYAHDASARIIPESIPCASHLYKVRLPARAQSGRVHKVTNVHPPGHYWAKDLQGMLVHTSYLQGASSFKKQWSK